MTDPMEAVYEVMRRELIFTRVDDAEWEVRIMSTHVPRPGELVKLPEETTGDMARGLIYRVDDVIWNIDPNINGGSVEIQLIDV